ncbi:MAG: SCP2 sterol-binding domain-containing protein [Clostridiales bacterium]|nr:SCP2 sterol-binding domain-containing protein [Clostridiales bacterium]MBE5778343.1 SCP2 sterol-binding domain-containing protein [Clostridiales bacterium]
MGKVKTQIRQMLDQVRPDTPLRELLDAVGVILSNNPDELRGITYAYRFCVTDTGLVKAFSLVDGQYFEKTEMDEADCILSATEKDMMDVFLRKQKPLTALLRGKLILSGSKAAMLRFAEFL